MRGERMCDTTLTVQHVLQILRSHADDLQEVTRKLQDEVDRRKAEEDEDEADDERGPDAERP